MRYEPELGSICRGEMQGQGQVQGAGADVGAGGRGRGRGRGRCSGDTHLRPRGAKSVGVESTQRAVLGDPRGRTLDQSEEVILGHRAAAQLVSGEVEHRNRRARSLEGVQQRVGAADPEPVVSQPELAQPRGSRSRDPSHNCERSSFCEPALREVKGAKPRGEREQTREQRRVAVVQPHAGERQVRRLGAPLVDRQGGDREGEAAQRGQVARDTSRQTRGELGGCALERRRRRHGLEQPLAKSEPSLNLEQLGGRAEHRARQLHLATAEGAPVVHVAPLGLHGRLRRPSTARPIAATAAARARSVAHGRGPG